MERIPVIDLFAYICILIPAKRYGIVLIVGNQSDLLINDSFFHICSLALSTGIVVSISFQKVYDTPHAKTCADCDYKSF